MKRFYVLAVLLPTILGLLISFASGYYYRNIEWSIWGEGVGFLRGIITFGFPFAWRTVHLNGTFGEPTIEHYDYNPAHFLLDTAILSIVLSSPVLSILYTRRKGMFKGAKTSLFWIGLVILGFTSVLLFSMLWYTLVLYRETSNIVNLIPFFVGDTVFILIGLYMMKYGVQKEKIRDDIKEKTA